MGIHHLAKMKLATGLMLLAFFCATASVLSSAEEPAVYPLNDAKDDSPALVQDDSKTLAESAQQAQQEEAYKEQEAEHVKEENEPSTNTYMAASSKLYEWAFGMPSGNASGPVLRRWKTTAVIIVADIASAVGREQMPRDSRKAPAICVPAADTVQNCGGPGRKPKNLATTLALKPSTFWILSKPWWAMSAQVPRRRAVMPTSVRVVMNSGCSASSARIIAAGLARPGASFGAAPASRAAPGATRATSERTRSISRGAEG